MQSSQEAEPTPLSPRRLMLMTAILVGLYFVVRFTTPSRTHPALVLAAIALGGVAGFLVAKWEAPSARRPRQGHRRSAADARWAMFGLAGSGLALSQVVPPSALDWVTLGVIALTTGAASHAWLKARGTRTLRRECEDARRHERANLAAARTTCVSVKGPGMRCDVG